MPKVNREHDQLYVFYRILLNMMMINRGQRSEEFQKKKMLLLQDIMVDPFILSETGVSYERSRIEAWIASSGCSLNTPKC